MSKTRTKRKSEKRISTAKAQDKWAKQKTWLNWLPVILSAAFLFALPYLTGTNNLFWTSILLSSVLAMGLLATIWLLWKRQPLTLTVAEIFLLAFVFWQWLTVVNSVYRWASMLEASRWTAFAVLVFAVKQLTGRGTRDEGQDAKQQLSHSAPHTSHPTWFAVSFVAAATVTAIHGIAEYALNAASGIPHWRIFGPFLQPNLFGNFLLLAFFVALGLAVQPPALRTLPFASIALLFLIAMALTGSKGALLAWFVGIVAFGTVLAVNFASPKLRRLIWGALFFGVAALILFASFLPPIRLRFETLWTSQAHSWIFRLLVWKATLVGAISKPIMGFGAGTFEWAYPQWTTVGFTRHAHNGFLQVALESGFVGLAFLLVFLTAVLFSRPNFQPSTHNAQPTDYAATPTLDPIRIGCKVAIVTFCLHNLVETAWMTLANLLALAFVCGMAMPKVRCSECEVQETQTRKKTQPLAPSTLHHALLFAPRNPHFALLLLTLLLLSLGLWHSVSVARGAYFAQQARSEMLPSSRLYWLELASESDPLNARHLIDRAILLEAWALATGDEERLKQALQLCDEAIKLQPTRSGNYKVKARILRELGRLQEAERTLRVALKVNRTDTEAILKLGELLEEMGKVSEAKSLYRQLIVLEKGPYGRYKPVEQWQDIFIAAGKIRLASQLIGAGFKVRGAKLLSEAETTLKSFLDAYLPILKASDPEVAESQNKFVETLLDEMRKLRKRGKVSPTR
ncbi:MAG: O-antigen ligase family protein [Candidatus Fervidibacter sacchari]